MRVVCAAALQVSSWPGRTHPRVLQLVLSLSCRAQASVVRPSHRPAGSCACIHPRPEPASRGAGVMERSLETLSAGLHSLRGERARGVSCCQAAVGDAALPPEVGGMSVAGTAGAEATYRSF